MYKTILTTPPAIELTLSLPFMLKLGSFYPKASIFLKTCSGASHDFLNGFCEELLSLLNIFKILTTLNLITIYKIKY